MKSAILAAALTLWVVSEAQSQAIPHGDMFTKPATVSDLGNQINYSVRSILPPPQESSGIKNNVWNTTEKIVSRLDYILGDFDYTDVNRLSMPEKFNLSKNRYIGDRDGFNISSRIVKAPFANQRTISIGYSHRLGEYAGIKTHFNAGIQLERVSNKVLQLNIPNTSVHRYFISFSATGM
jgi:hypothetical protein